jgi:hypothetical protein
MVKPIPIRYVDIKSIIALSLNPEDADVRHVVLVIGTNWNLVPLEKHHVDLGPVVLGLAVVNCITGEVEN